MSAILALTLLGRLAHGLAPHFLPPEVSSCSCMADPNAEQLDQFRVGLTELSKIDPLLRSVGVHDLCKIAYPIIFQGLYLPPDDSEDRMLLMNGATCYEGLMNMAVVCAQSEALRLQRHRRGMERLEAEELNRTRNSVATLMDIAVRFGDYHLSCCGAGAYQNAAYEEPWLFSLEEVIQNMVSAFESKDKWLLLPPFVERPADQCSSGDANASLSWVDSMRFRLYWARGVESEAVFWRQKLNSTDEEVTEWIRTGSIRWNHDGYGICRYLQNWRDRNVEKHPIERMRILNAGSGPLTPTVQDCEIEVAPKRKIIARVQVDSADALGRYYARILDDLRLTPVSKPPHPCPVEELWRCYPANYYTVTHMVNALDHAYDPMAGLRQLLHVTAPGGYVLLRHAQNEGVPGGFRFGLHQWAFTVDSRGHFIIWNPSGKIDATKALDGIADVEAELRTHPSGNVSDTKYVWVDMRKLVADSTTLAATQSSMLLTLSMSGGRNSRQLSIYNEENNLSVFEFDRGDYPSEPAPSTALLFMGGLTDGFLRPSFTTLFAKRGLRVFQILMRSSYTAFGYSSLDTDVEDMAQALAFLKKYRNVEHVVLMGHSTGCQDVVYFTKKVLQDISKSDELPTIDGCIVQAAVSDRDSVDLEVSGSEEKTQDLEDMRDLAMSLLETDPKQLMPAKAMQFTANYPVTAARFASLYCRRAGPDDMFSRDLTDEELEESLGHMAKVPKVLLVQGLKDEYVEHSLPSINNRLADAMGARLLEISGNHGLDNCSPEELERFINAIVEFVQEGSAQ
ncbi:hypothetical protein FOL47_003789 [Perkinsus chesapeaki]|uniref:Uncharacterized protein n=1 Tax=Perkinsus chesapeaki TaxID=330153 RepID=A0A7J6M657_PERCH|nr:hypothetical protein FOL47_003789 [Perkinsus chesapeaki]